MDLSILPSNSSSIFLCLSSFFISPKSKSLSVNSGFTSFTNSENFIGKRILSSGSSAEPPLLPGISSVECFKSIECEPVTIIEQFTKSPFFSKYISSLDQPLTAQISSKNKYFLSDLSATLQLRYVWIILFNSSAVFLSNDQKKIFSGLTFLLCNKSLMISLIRVVLPTCLGPRIV